MSGHYTSLKAFADVFQQGLPILMYHVVGPRPRGVRLKGLYVSSALFNRQLRELKEAGYSTPSYDVAATPGASGGRQILLTMDDATRKAGQHALPLLLKHGCRAIQFVVADRMGSYNHWQVAQGEVKEPLMDTAELRDWLAAGQEIGAHTMTHPRLTQISRERAREEIVSSKKKLEDTFGRPILHFCYPYGDHDPGIMDLVAEAGYQSACTVMGGINTSETSPFALRRYIARYRSRKLKTVVRLVRGWLGFGKGANQARSTQ
ncbi:MAG: polysaccharide deacetylase family protein [Limisphaerales bacterium]|jgi:peptidoglycan/xylan/chitin deacetylase (PgdA/CDA1 family)